MTEREEFEVWAKNILKFGSDSEYGIASAAWKAAKESAKYEMSGCYARARDAEAKLDALAKQEPVVWHKGNPPHPFDQEWFIAITIYGDKVVLVRLPEEYAFDYKTADDTYMLAGNVKCWSQFPSSEYVTYTALKP